MTDPKSYRTQTRGTPLSREKAKTLRRALTPHERKLWLCLKRKQLSGLAFRKQAPIGDYIADFYCHGARLVVEVDGSTHQGDRLAHDSKRDDWMQRQGIFILRFPVRDVDDHCQSVLDRIRIVGLKRADELDRQRVGR